MEDQIDFKNLNEMLEIKPLPTAKNKIKERLLMKEKIIPGIGKSVLNVGCSGSGKSTLLANLLQKKQFYGIDKGKPYFDKTVIFSSNAGKAGDDIYKNISYLDEDNFINDLETAPLYIDILLQAQKDDIEQNGIENAKKLLLVFDDVLSAPSLLKSRQFLKLFVEIRHYCASTIINTQSFTKVPRSCRLSCNIIYFFPASLNEQLILCESHCPPNKNKKQFLKLINEATNKRYSFLTIDMTQPLEKRYRRNLNEYFTL